MMKKTKYPSRSVYLLTVFLVVIFTISFSTTTCVEARKNHHHRNTKNHHGNQRSHHEKRGNFHVPSPSPMPSSTPAFDPTPRNPYMNKSNIFDVLSFGAKGDGVADDFKALQAAWKAACKVEGGIVEIPSEFRFLIRPISLQGPCRPHLVLQIDGVMLASPNIGSWSKSDSYQWINIKWVKNFTIQGGGVVDGQDFAWWKPNEQKTSKHMQDMKPTALRFYESSGVTVRHISIIVNSPLFHLKFDNSSFINVNNVTMVSPGSSRNKNGIHLQNSQHVEIQHSNAALGEWKLLQSNIGVSAMHMQLLHNDRVIIFDRTNFGRSNLSLPNGVCRHRKDEVLKVDCTAHSIEYNVDANSFRPLMVQTDTWCSSGSVLANGSLLQTGGHDAGKKKYRVFRPCATCDWQEFDGLNAPRWYATNHILPDGRVIVIGGRRAFSYEFYPTTKTLINFPFLVETNDKGEENNLYPFVHLNVDGNLFIFANNRAILFDYNKNTIVRTYPQIPGADPRNYPSSGSSVLLPLSAAGTEAEVLICGGAPKGSYAQAKKRISYLTALRTCGRMKITDSSPQWFVESMPTPRVMGDMVLLPDGSVLILNGASSGTAGWGFARNPVLSPVIYRPDNAVGSRFEIQAPSSKPRMYHSTAVLLRDGRVLIGGSNTHDGYKFYGVDFPTDLTLEAFSPAYLGSEFASIRPTILSPTAQTNLKYGEILRVRYTVSGRLSPRGVTVTMISPSFTTHSFSMNQRFLHLGGGNSLKVSNSTYITQVRTPKSSTLAPSGYYILYVIHQGIPSEGTWVHIE
ncbi:aldehyde oxidase GLOX-like isoform X2 [Papaver somniferum]|uniref:aldehyde oxidase GLOX-like isoform X2 n=1 Tax=Papaver somniferum TaxID=3469 RepID=UPI000E6F8702|nr:aldehyde oxidase GLOX-like isoform X2 [Papaver somniferum]XP_026395391.1 aldehyde oxidase GLOX-like isoform X2 [Papaver somniferum]